MDWKHAFMGLNAGFSGSDVTSLRLCIVQSYGVHMRTPPLETMLLTAVSAEWQLHNHVYKYFEASFYHQFLLPVCRVILAVLVATLEKQENIANEKCN